MSRAAYRLTLGEVLVSIAILAVALGLIAVARRQSGGPPLRRPPVRKLAEPRGSTLDANRTINPAGSSATTAPSAS